MDKKIIFQILSIFVLLCVGCSGRGDKNLKEINHHIDGFETKSPFDSAILTLVADTSTLNMFEKVSMYDSNCIPKVYCISFSLGGNVDYMGDKVSSSSDTLLTLTYYSEWSGLAGYKGATLLENRAFLVFDSLDIGHKWYDEKLLDQYPQNVFDKVDCNVLVIPHFKEQSSVFHLIF